jgi:UrcA family protein
MNSKLKTRNPVFVAYAAATALTCVLLASNAYADDQPRSETVKFADLDLSTQAGAEALYDRIHAAARHVCTQPGSLVWSGSACMRKAESEAIGKVNAPLLVAYYQKKTGSRPQTLTANR